MSRCVGECGGGGREMYKSISGAGPDLTNEGQNFQAELSLILSIISLSEQKNGSP